MREGERRIFSLPYFFFSLNFLSSFLNTQTTKGGRTTTWDETDDTKEDNNNNKKKNKNEGANPPPNREEDEAQHLGDAGLFVLPEQTRHRGKAAEIGNGLRVYRSGELREKIIVVERERERDVVLLCGHSRGYD